MNSFANTLWKFADIDECNNDTDNCHQQASCNDTDGSFTCTCNTGWSGDGVNCSGKLKSANVNSPVKKLPTQFRTTIGGMHLKISRKLFLFPLFRNSF